MTTELLPTNYNNPQARDISQILIESLTNCHKLEGSIAFWTLDTDALNGELLQALCRAGSFVCVDLHNPTDLKKIVKFAEAIDKRRQEQAIHICLAKNPAQNRESLVSILHTKLLVFSMGNRQWEIWVGSHNFTRQAILGGNLEASVRIRGYDNEVQFAALLAQAQTYLRYIRSFCDEFDPNKITYYEGLRGDIDEAALLAKLKAAIGQSEIIIRRVLTLQSEKANQLGGQTIIILGNLSGELGAVRFRNRGGTSVLLRVRDVDSRQVYTYHAYLRANDLINNEPSFNVSFNRRRWAVRRVNKKREAITPPILEQIRDVDAQLIQESRYYVNVQIEDRIDNFSSINYYTYPETEVAKLWRSEYESGTGRIDWSFTQPIYEETPTSERSVILVPTEQAEDLTTIKPLPWTEDYKEGILDKQVIAFVR